MNETRSRFVDEPREMKFLTLCISLDEVQTYSSWTIYLFHQQWFVLDWQDFFLKSPGPSLVFCGTPLGVCDHSEKQSSASFTR